MRLLRFVARRLLQVVPVLLGVVVLTFVLVRVLPGDPIRTILGPNATEADADAARARFGLDKPMGEQFLDYLQGLVTGRLGDHSVRVLALIGNSMPEFWLGLVLILVGYSALGWFPAPSGRVDPDTDLTPLTGADLIDAVLTANGPAFTSALSHLILPVATLAIVVVAPLLRSVRASALEVLRSEAYLAAT